MPRIIIAGTPIDIPNTGAAPVYSEPIIKAFQAIEEALSGVVSTGDISKQSYTLTASQNPAANVTITGLAFATSAVRAAVIRYSVFRSTTTSSVAESGQIYVNYNASRPVNQKWEFSQDYTGDASITFDITDDGQVRFTTTAIAGTNHTGLITFTAQAFLQ